MEKFSTCQFCEALFDYPHSDNSICQMCQKGYDVTVQVSQPCPLLRAGSPIKKFTVHILRFPPCETFPTGIVLQHDAVGPGRPAKVEIKGCACNYIGNFGIWISLDVTKLPNCNGKVYIGTIFDGPFKNGITKKTSPTLVNIQ